MRMSAELADIAMDLARLAGARAKSELSEPEPEQAQAPEPLPQASEPAAVIPVQAAAVPRMRGATIRIPASKPGDHATLFTRLAATALACMAFHHRLVTGTVATKAATAAALPPCQDPRREKLLEGFRLVTKNLANRADRLRASTARIDEKLTADPEQAATVPDLLWDIAQELDIYIDLAQLPDEFLPPPDKSDNIDIQDLIRRCATYPPHPKR